MAEVSIIIRAKNAASAAFDRVKQDVKGTAEETQKASLAMTNATSAISKAMSGDIVGAAQMGMNALKNLWAVIMANPFIAIAFAIGAATVALVKWSYAAKQAAADAKLASTEAERFAQSLDEIERGTRLQQETDNAHDMTMTRLDDELARHSEVAENKKRLAQEAADAVMSANEDERDAAKAWAEEKKKAYADEMAIVKMYTKEIENRATSEAEANAKSIEDAKKRADELIEAEEKIQDAKNKIEDDWLKQEAARTAKELEDGNKAADKALEERQKMKDKLVDLRQEQADEELEIAKQQLEKENDLLDKANAKSAELNDKFSTASDMKKAQEARRQDREDAKAARRDQTKYLSALKAAEKGITGKHITAALEAEKGKMAAMDAFDATIRAGDELKDLQDAHPELSKLDGIKTEIEKLNSALVGGA